MQTTRQPTKRLSDIVFDICTDSGLTIREVRSGSIQTEHVRCRREIANEAVRHGYRVREIGRAINRSHGAVRNLLGRVRR